MRGKIIADALRLPIAKKHQRITELNDLNQRYRQIITERAARHAAEDDAPAEASSGMLVRQPKISASGKVVTEWAFDKSLDSAIKETHKQAAQELGQWEETINHNHTVNQYHDDRLNELSAEQLLQIRTIMRSGGA